MRCLIIADSLGMPRNEGDNIILWEETWPSLLRCRFSQMEFINLSQRARQSSSLLVTSLFEEYIVFFKPDIIIYQVGIVDCMPRIISQRMKSLLNLRILHRQVFPQSFRNWYIKSRSKKRKKITASDPLALVYTKPKQFQRCYENFIQRVNKELSNSCKHIILPILIDELFMEEKSPGAKTNKNLYNQILKYLSNIERVSLISEEEILHTVENDFFCSDGYHLNSKGNQVVARATSQYIERLLNK